MAATLTCKKCVVELGFKLSDKDRIFETEEQFFNHLEEVHGTPVARKGETEEEAMERCAKKGIVPDKEKCKCRECREKRGEISST